MRQSAPIWRGLSAPLLARRTAWSLQASRPRLYTAAAGQQGIDPSKLVVQKTEKPKTLQKPEDLVFGNSFTGTARLLPPLSRSYARPEYRNNPLTLTHTHPQTTCS